MRLSALRRWRLRHFPPPARGKWAIPEEPGRFDGFLLMGQSNMAGFGGVRDDDPWKAGDFEPLSGALVLGGQSKIKDARPRGAIRWRPAAHPLHLHQRSAGFGLGLSFAAERLREQPECTVGLVPCAWGGAPIAKLGPGSPSFENTLRRAREAQRVGRLRAVLWHQGESDALDADSAAAHADHLRKLIATLRTELGAPKLVFLIGDLADFGGRPGERAHHDRVRAGLRVVADEDARAAFVESEGLKKVDAVHFGRDALIEFGRRYAAAYAERSS